MKLWERIGVSIVASLFVGLFFYGISFGSCFGYPKSNWCENGESASILFPIIGCVLVFALISWRTKR